MSPRRRVGPALPLLLTGLFFHAVYLATIFDIYFVSPVVRVSKRYATGTEFDSATRVLDPLSERGNAVGERLADRLVLIVGDGLRADKLYDVYPSEPFPDQLAPIPYETLHIPPPGPRASYLTPANTTTPAPYLRSLILDGKASWGVSHTRVPTESRPGHVAIIAGMYEDVSAVLRGWKMNPVTFDSILNQSTQAFGMGSPDIVPMFKHGAQPTEKVSMWCYDEEDEDFTQDAIQLDLWVLEHLRQLFRNATSGANPTLATQLHQPGVVFFFHLLGLDTTGHSYRPHSAEYYRNIQVVDRIVEALQDEFDSFYGKEASGKTAWLFTADHGMSNIGNHGDGDPDNTRTPLLAWGQGVRGSEETGLESGGEEGDRRGKWGHDEYSKSWLLDSRNRIDVEQADLAPLMSTIIGIPIPGNSVGRLPLDYLKSGPEFRARAAYANALEILEQFQVKHDLKAAHAIAFQPFAELPEEDEVAKVRGTASFGGSVVDRRLRIEAALRNGRYDDAEKDSVELIDVALRGLRYLQTYDWLLLRVIVVAGYLGWMAYGLNFILRVYVFENRTPPGTSFSSFLAPAFVVGGVAVLYARFIVEKAPVTYYLYAAFPGYFWSSILRDPWAFRALLSSKPGSASKISIILGSVPILLFLLISLEAMVLGYFRRVVWTVGFVLLGTIWPLLGMPKQFRDENKALGGLWSMICIGTSVFTVLPVEKGESLPVIMAGGLAFLGIGALAIRQTRRPPTPVEGKLPLVKRFMADTVDTLTLQAVLIAMSMVVTTISARSLQMKKGLPLPSQIAGWVLFFISSAIPFLRGSQSRQRPHIHRIAILIFAFAPVFIILSISYETLFYFFFSAALCVWLVIEMKLSDFRLHRYPTSRTNAGTASIDGNKAKTKADANEIWRNLEPDHFRISLIFLFFIHVGFFGTGNIASISSFYLEPVYRLVPVFNPFLMAALLVYKLLIPFLIVSAVFSILNTHMKLPPFALFSISLTISDVLTLSFFFLVTDEGSWLEIGRSISHFSIASLLLVFNVLLFFLGDAVMGQGGLEQESDGAAAGRNGEANKEVVKTKE